MRFLIFNLVVAGALIYLFSSDGRQPPSIAEQAAKVSRSLEAENGSAKDIADEGDRRDGSHGLTEAASSGLDTSAQPNESATQPDPKRQAMQDLVSDLWDEVLAEEEASLEPPAGERQSRKQEAKAGSTRLATEKPNSRRISSFDPASGNEDPLPEPPPLPASDPAADRIQSTEPPQARADQEGFVASVAPDVAARRDLVVGSESSAGAPRKAPEVRRRELLQLVQDMELFAIEALSE